MPVLVSRGTILLEWEKEIQNLYVRLNKGLLANMKLQMEGIDKITAWVKNKAGS